MFILTSSRWFKEPPCRFDFTHPHTQFKFQMKLQYSFNDEPRGPTEISPLQVGPPTRRELAPRYAPLIFDREALRAPAYKLCRLKSTTIVSEWPSLNSITCALTFSPHTGAPHWAQTTIVTHKDYCPLESPLSHGYCLHVRAGCSTG
jgi:hypothetical protein